MYTFILFSKFNYVKNLKKKRNKTLYLNSINKENLAKNVVYKKVLIRT